MHTDDLLKEGTEAATKTIFKNICSFLPEAPFSKFFQEAFHRTDTNFPGRKVCLIAEKKKLFDLRFESNTFLSGINKG